MRQAILLFGLVQVVLAAGCRSTPQAATSSSGCSCPGVPVVMKGSLNDARVEILKYDLDVALRRLDDIDKLDPRQRWVTAYLRVAVRICRESGKIPPDVRTALEQEIFGTCNNPRIECARYSSYETE